MSGASTKRQTRCESGTQSHGADLGQPGYRNRLLVPQCVRWLPPARSPGCGARAVTTGSWTAHPMRTLRTVGTLAVAGSVLALLPVGSAMAASTGDTTATFTLAGGSLDVTAAAGAALDDGAPGVASVSGSLGSVAVSDTRGSTAGWVVSASSSTFVDTAGSSSTGVSYDSGAATATSGTVTAASAGATASAAEAPVATGTAASGNNTASFAPTLTVTLPASALAGDYQGTVTTSIA